MDTGGGLLGIWHPEGLQEHHHFFLSTHLIMHEHGWPMMQSRQRGEVSVNSMGFSTFTKRHWLQMVLAVYIVVL
jgi:hypothetical protein